MYANNDKLAYMDHQNQIDQHDHHNKRRGEDHFVYYESPFHINMVTDPSQSFAFSIPVPQQFSLYNMYPNCSKPYIILPHKNYIDLNGNMNKINRK